jgi:hypothetical protein
MKTYNTPATHPASPRVSPAYLLMNIAFALVLPAVSSVAEHYIDKAAYCWHLVAKWLIFWGAGMRLFTAGLRQAATPEYTAIHILKLKGKESYVVIRELGFANISLGIMGILSVLNDSWRMLAALAGSIFFGFAALQHGARKPCGLNEKVAFWYDTLVSIGLTAYLLSHY